MTTLPMADSYAIETHKVLTNERKEKGLAEVALLMSQGASPEDVYAKCVSIHQSHNSTNGSFLEKIIEDLLTARGIPFLRQVSDQGGVISAKKRGCVHDIIIDAKLGDSLKDKIVISCKTSLRERYKQDGHLLAKEVCMVTFDHPRTLDKYGVNIVSIGKDDALEKLLSRLAAEQLSKDTSGSCCPPFSSADGSAPHPTTTPLHQTPEA